MATAELKKKCLCGIFITTLFFISSIHFAHAWDFGEKSGLDETAKGMGLPTAEEDDEVNLFERVGLALQFLISFLALVFFALILYAGWVWMLARGNEQEVEKAKNILTSAIVGLAIVLSAYGITLMAKMLLMAK
jgi:cbb3-type cytochrome oxidase subunit 3